MEETANHIQSLITADDMKDLFNAAYYGNLRLIDLALEKGELPEQRDATGLSPLHIAAASGHRTAMEMLLAKGCNIRDKDAAGNSVLHLAVRNGHLDLFKWLLEKGFDINETTMKGRTPMDIAKLYCRAHIVDYIKKATREKMAWELDITKSS